MRDTPALCVSAGETISFFSACYPFFRPYYCETISIISVFKFQADYIISRNALQLLAYLLRKISNLLRIKISSEDRKQQSVCNFLKKQSNLCALFSIIFISNGKNLLFLKSHI